MREIIGGLVLMLSLGCATVAPPQQLLEARQRFDAAAHSDVAQRNFIGLWEVRGSLDEANRLYASEPGSARSQAAARKALTDLHRWELMVQVEKLDATMDKVASSAELSEPMVLGHSPPHSELEGGIGALGAAVHGVGEIRLEPGSVTLRFAQGALFDRGERELKVSARIRLEQAAAALKQYSPDARVRVVASADDRARLVRDCLVESGVPAQNVTSNGAAATDEAHQVEIVIEPLDLPR